MFKRVRGTQDILPPGYGQAGQDSCLWQGVEAIARRTFSLYGYREIRTPVLENAALFNRSLGESTEIVQKQMLEVKHAKDDLVLRPEGTASVVRAYLENNLDKNKDTSKLYYLGPMFRAERPQKGRLRQFHHIGIEAIGSLSPYLDIEVISLSDSLLKALGVNNYQICLNSLGCPDDKARLARDLRQRLKAKLPKLCFDCRGRFNRNIFRILDCKNPACREIVNDLKMGQDYLCPECAAHFRQITDGLSAINVRYKLSYSLVRGLDYYTRTVFEIKHAQLGAQDALGAGGRYDTLVGQLGGRECGAIGVAFGVERILLVKGPAAAVKGRGLVYIITLGEKADKKGIELLHSLRVNNIPADMDYAGRSLKAKMRQANESGARFCVIIGEDELVKGNLSLKDMDSGEQSNIADNQLLKHLLSSDPGLLVSNNL
ncbi:MAG: histidine--tRNA ligase [Candidatus Omnitrophota bacterium]